ncbi:MAG: hypothetical protein KTR26_02375, partial [Flammeovirgaceae bacterium]|nr:hypothetical protein [Flammeovirgaceae bacterium]
MKTYPLIMSLLLFLVSQVSFAQSDDCENGWCWGADPGTAKEKYALASDNIKMKAYDAAKDPLDWLLENTPNLNKSIYIHGVSLYSNLLKKEQKEGNDPIKVVALQDKVLDLYETRIKYFGEEADVRARMGKLLYFYLKDRKDDTERWDTMMKAYYHIFELNGVKTSRSNLTFLMLAVVNQKAKKKLTEEEVLDHYDQITEVIEENIAKSKGESQNSWKDCQDKIDGLLAKAVTIDCNFVREKMADKIKNNPEDVKTSKRAIKYMLNDKCTDDPLFLLAAENLYKAEPTAGLAGTISKKYQIEKDYEKAIEWKRKGIELAGEDKAKQAELTFESAQIYSVQGKKSGARTEAYKVAELDPSKAGEAYELIGDLYYTSGKECADADP